MFRFQRVYIRNEKMAACLRLRAACQTLSQGCGCRHVLLTSIQPLSFLATQQQAQAKPLMDRSQFTCLVPRPHHRQEVTFSKKHRKFTPRHQEDGVSPDMMLVYENNMNRLNFWGQLTINLLAVPIFGMSANIVISSWPITDMSITSGPLAASVYIITYVGLLTGVNGICKRSVHRIYTDADASKFAAVVQDWKMTRQTVHFDLASAERKPPSKVMGSFFGNMKILGRSYLVTPSDFVQPQFYNLLMGYQLQRPIERDIIKDIDLKDAMRSSAKNVKRPSKGSG